MAKTSVVEQSNDALAESVDAIADHMEIEAMDWGGDEEAKPAVANLREAARRLRRVPDANRKGND